MQDSPSQIVQSASFAKTPGILTQERVARVRALKKISIGTVALIAAAVAGWTLAGALQQGTTASWGWFLLALLLWLSLYSFSSLFSSWQLNLILSIVELGLLLFPFWQTLSLQPFVVLTVSAGTLASFAGSKMRWKHAALLKISTGQILNAGLPWLLLTLSLLFSSVYFFTLSQVQNTQQFFLTEGAIQAILRSSSGAIQTFVPSFRPDMTVSEFLSSFGTVGQMLGQTLPPSPLQVHNVPGMKAAPQESLSAALLGYLMGWYQKLPGAIQKNVIFGWVIIFFFILWSLGWIVAFFARIVFWITFEAFKGIKLIMISRVPTEKEALTL